jgi:hypothetical protein
MDRACGDGCAKKLSHGERKSPVEKYCITTAKRNGVDYVIRRTASRLG